MMDNKPKIKPWQIVAVSVLLFAFSLTQTAFHYSDYDGNKAMSSLEAFFAGSVAILGGGLMEWLTWLANPFYVIAVIFFIFKKRAAVSLSAIAASIAFSFMFWNNILASESGRTAGISGLSTGYYLWLLSLLLLAVGSSYFFKKQPVVSLAETKNFKDNFSQQSAVYLKYRPQYPDELYAWLASQTPEQALAWDCGTGNGQAAIGLSKYFQKVIATDPSEQQISNAMKADNVTYHVEKAEDIFLEDHSVDLITVANALHWFNFDSFYAQAKRVLKKEGIIAAWGCGLPVINPEVDTIVKAFHDDTLGYYWQPENKLVEEKYETIPFPFEQLDAPPFAAVKMMNLDDFLGFINTWSAVQRFINQEHYNPVARLNVNLLKIWPPEELKEIKWELILKVGKKQ